MYSEISIFRISITLLVSSVNVDSLRYFKSLAKSSWYSSSEVDPMAILTNLLKSGLEFRPHPSARLVGIEAAERLI